MSRQSATRERAAGAGPASSRSGGGADGGAGPPLEKERKNEKKEKKEKKEPKIKTVEQQAKSVVRMHYNSVDDIYPALPVQYIYICLPYNSA